MPENESGSNLLEGHVWNVRSIARVLQGQAAEIALRINVQQRVLIKFACLRNSGRAELDVQRIGVLEE